jgi:hypothetical protein
MSRSAGVPEARRSSPRLAAIGLELLLVERVIFEFEITSRAFAQLSALAAFGFLLHHALPTRARPPFFLALSALGVLLVLGPLQGILLLSAGLALFGIAQLPAGLRVRVALLAAAGGGFACVRGGWVDAPRTLDGVIPPLASMFMFRLALYLRDAPREKRRAPLTQRLSYFFLLPNVCFPLFPVVDYRIFVRTWYARSAPEIYQRGLHWMARGVVQLLLYRLVYHELALGPTEVGSAPQLLRYLLATYLLYLQVSGHFHLAVGMLHLFGFDLPETNHRYFLAVGFNDFWRRINIYWKDFLVKTVYDPILFRLRRSGELRATVAATLAVFFATWLLHSYQWFWLRGSLLLTAPDALFWCLLGTLSLLNTLGERHSRRRRGGAARVETARRRALHALGGFGTFAVMCVLWSLWSSTSMREWLSLWGVADEGAGRALLLVALAGAGWVAVGALPTPERSAAGRWLADFWSSPARAAAALGCLAIVGSAPFAPLLSGESARVLANLQSNRLNEVDARRQQRGYYESIAVLAPMDLNLASLYRAQPDDWLPLEEIGGLQETGDYRLTELRPSLSLPYKHARLVTNRFGMRDQDYELAKPPGTWRVALLGSSIEMGTGVENDETFEAVLEEGLNGAGDGRRHEVMNFANEYYDALRNLLLLEQRVLPFGPDAVLYVAHENEVDMLLVQAERALGRGARVPWGWAAEAFAAAGVDGSEGTFRFRRRLGPEQGLALVARAYREIAQRCRGRGIAPVWVFLPNIPSYPEERQVAPLVRAAEEAGFRVVNLLGVYAGRLRSEITVAPWDAHPNPLGHRLVAELLHQRLREIEGLLPRPGALPEGG